MNKAILIGRLTRDAEVRQAQGENGFAVAKFTLAVDRRFKKDAEQKADFISCVAFGKTAEFFGKFGHKGAKFVIEGRIQTGSFTGRDGNKVYTTDVVVENVEFAESKSQNGNQQPQAAPTPATTPMPTSVMSDFMNIPDSIDEELPFT